MTIKTVTTRAPALCRCCNVEFPKGTTMLFSRPRAHNFPDIRICFGCGDLMGRISKGQA